MSLSVLFVTLSLEFISRLSVRKMNVPRILFSFLSLNRSYILGLASIPSHAENCERHSIFFKIRITEERVALSRTETILQIVKLEPRKNSFLHLMRKLPCTCM